MRAAASRRVGVPTESQYTATAGINGGARGGLTQTSRLLDEGEAGEHYSTTTLWDLPFDQALVVGPCTRRPHTSCAVSCKKMVSHHSHRRIPEQEVKQNVIV